MLGELGIKSSRSRPYHPQTCGKVERFHQTLKKHLRALPPAATIDAGGVITISYNSRLHHIGLSKHLPGTEVTVLIDDRNIRVLHRGTGQLIRKLTLDPTATTAHAASNAETHPKTGSR
ncbi:hypothetical protein A5698_23550 [Mycobacterium sp. E136]|nr:hypothetical protein A5698_23550 [Mycobacterium sp. E136]